MIIDLATLYQSALKKKAFEYQRLLALHPLGNRVLCLPTGSGKTATAILTWLYHRRNKTPNTPRRLVYCLPMRALVEQTRDLANDWITELKIDIPVCTLMGGEEEQRDWDVHPERDAILIGTQDMLLSRALNRGFAMSRYRWPMHFALLNNDCFWVMDEVQLSGSGLATSTQLQAFRDSFGTLGPAATWWMSATLEKDWLKTIDHQGSVELLPQTQLEKDDLKAGGELAKRFHAEKPVAALKRFSSESILDVHRSGTVTLVVVNTVNRARQIYASLEEAKPKRANRAAKSVQPERLLLHSRFRPPDRAEAYKKLRLADLICRDEKTPETEPAWEARVREYGIIVVATQVVEAGIDISAETMITDLAPWPSLVQRFGRCNRYGNQTGARIYWVDPGKKKENAAPYEPEDLEESRQKLAGLQNASPANLTTRGKLNQPPPVSVIRWHDFTGLFATEPDLAGGFTDVSRFVRDQERETDVYVYWRVFDKVPSKDEARVTAAEICSVPLGAELEALLKKRGCWLWNGESRLWQRLASKMVRPGMTLLLQRETGGYDALRGWTGNVSDLPDVQPPIGATPNDSQQNDFGAEANDWVKLTQHLKDAETCARELAKEFPVTPQERDALVLAAKWHDVGKNHQRWQESLQQLKPEPKGTGPWAKFPRNEYNRNRFRPTLRHEAASVLACWPKWVAGEEGWTALALYLVAAHHGKVRTVLRRRPRDREGIFGVAPCDKLQLAGWIDELVELEISPGRFGGKGDWNGQDEFDLLAPGWVEVIADLTGTAQSCGAIPDGEPKGLGPFRLAMFEAIVRAADAKASGFGPTKDEQRCN